ncbi:MAG: murein L,D-transpeptidase [Gammaproteobacteria bacterium]
MNSSIRCVTLLCFILLANLSNVGRAHEEHPSQEFIRQSIEHLRQFDELHFGDESIAATRLVSQLYERRHFQPAWNDDKTVDDLLRSIEASESDGLTPEDYHQAVLLRSRRMPDSDPKLVADMDLLLTDALIRLAYHIIFGKVDPERLDSNWNMARDIRNSDPVEAIQQAIDSGILFEIMEDYKPKHRFYTTLKAGLAKYRGLRRAGGWPTVPAGPTLKKGMSGERVLALQNRLVVTDSLSANSSSASQIFDEQMELAVKRFQQLHGLTADGAVGPNTLEALNVPVGVRIDQIRINLERARWVLRDIPESFVIANIADFKALYIRDSEIVWEARIQVGKPYRKTPVFKAEIKYLVFNPTWTVPPTILEKDILPKARKDLTYLSARNIQVIDRSGKVVDASQLDWSKYTAKTFPYMLRQQPGPRNALGRVKFIFPNKHFVFMHDTASKALFEREVRTFSSGCIRLDRPFELAELLLNDEIKWNAAEMAKLVQSGKTRTVYLQKPLPVLLFYWTTPIARNGSIRFVKDVYERDPAILAELDGRFKLRVRDTARKDAK